VVAIISIQNSLWMNNFMRASDINFRQQQLITRTVRPMMEPRRPPCGLFHMERSLYLPSSTLLALNFRGSHI
jgi:hypothetical protein